MYMTDSEFIDKYPEQKPVCFNYAAARADVLALREENMRLQKRALSIDEVSRFLQTAGFEDAGKALYCRYDV